MVAERSLVRPGFDRRVAVSLGGALSIDVALVDVHLDRVDAERTCVVGQQAEDRRSGSLAATIWLDGQLAVSALPRMAPTMITDTVRR